MYTAYTKNNLLAFKFPEKQKISKSDNFETERN